MSIKRTVSVIIPCFNVEKWIDRCLFTVIEQSLGLENIEIICVDDCSTDDTVKKLYEWEEKYPDSFVIVESEVNGRQGRARNIGLQYASAEWIAFVDSDDWIEKNYLEEMIMAAENGEYDVICCRYGRDFSKNTTYYSDNIDSNTQVENNVIDIEVKESRISKYTDVIISSDDERKELIINPILKYSVWAKIIRKSFLLDNDISFPINITYEDAVWGSLVHLYVNKARIVDKMLYHYFVNEDSTVLKQNSFHHFDGITAQTILWQIYEERGFFNSYREELEIEHIFSACLPVLKAAIYRYSPSNYSMYLLIRTIMIGRIGDYKNNIYVKNGYLSEIHMLLMEAIENELTKAEFFNLAENVKKIGI